MAGGLGTRGRPYTEYVPKAMIPIRGRPVIDYVVGHVRSFASEAIIVSDYAGLGGQIRNYFGERDGVTFVQDTQSGTAGELRHLAPMLEGEAEFILWFADNLCALDLGDMVRHFRAKGGMACIATRSKRREETGFARVKDGAITEFMEKPTIHLELAECLGIYVLSGKVLGTIRKLDKAEPNLSYDVLQPLSKSGMVSAYDIGDAAWVDAESPAALARNKEAVEDITGLMAR